MELNPEPLIELCKESLMNDIRQLTDGEIKALLNDDAKLDSMIASLPQISTIQEHLDRKTAKIKTKMEENVCMKPVIEEVKEKLTKSSEDVVNAELEIAFLKAQLDNVAESRSMGATLALLQVSAHEAQDESEKIAREFRNGDMEIERFVKEYKEKRLIAHKREIKAKKLGEVLRSSTPQLPQISVSAPFIPFKVKSQSFVYDIENP